jgi:hypothetical protein
MYAPIARHEQPESRTKPARPRGCECNCRWKRGRMGEGHAHGSTIRVCSPVTSVSRGKRSPLSTSNRSFSNSLIHSELNPLTATRASPRSGNRSERPPAVFLNRLPYVMRLETTLTQVVGGLYYRRLDTLTLLSATHSQICRTANGRYCSRQPC